MVVQDNAKQFEKLPLGLQSAVCLNNVDLGMQPGFQGQVTHKMALIFELAETMKEGEFAGKRFLVSKIYTASLNEKSNLSKDLTSWRGKAFTPEERAGFDLDRLVGVNCTLNMIEVQKQDGNTTVVIGGIMPKLKGVEDMTPENPPDYVPKWITKMLSQEQPGTTADDFHDDIPF